jgi:hypothetical protein
MKDTELLEIIETYNWIKISPYKFEDNRNPNVEWKYAYNQLLAHHREANAFLINKCRELAEELLDKQ